MANNITKSQSVAVVMVPLPAQGHLNQLLHLSRRLVSAAHLPVFYLGAATHIRQAKLRAHGRDPPSDIIHFHEFPTPSFQNPDPDPNEPTGFPVQVIPSFYASTYLRDPVFAFVKYMSTKYKRVVVIYDSLMAYVVQDIVSIPNAESYCFESVSAFAIYFLRPDFPGEAGSILKGFPGPAGFIPKEITEFVALQRSLRKSASGNIFNSNRLIEGLYLDLVAKVGAEKQFAIGPFNPVIVNEPELKIDGSRIRHECLDWLDKQESANSVVFVSFGTSSSISDDQVQEIAIGLEHSRHRFIWVLREADKGDIFAGETRNPVLPEGFGERVKERGMIVRDWAPQLEILGHSSTGCFLSHCGWNSCIESISNGVPIATWPMHSDQPVNAVLVTKVLKIGVEVKDWGSRDEIVSSRVVENAVRKLMGSEGDEIRKRAKELGDAVKSSVMEGGVSSKEMHSFIAHITR